MNCNVSMNYDCWVDETARALFFVITWTKKNIKARIMRPYLCLNFICGWSHKNTCDLNSTNWCIATFYFLVREFKW